MKDIIESIKYLHRQLEKHPDVKAIYRKLSDRELDHNYSFFDNESANKKSSTFSLNFENFIQVESSVRKPGHRRTPARRAIVIIPPCGSTLVTIQSIQSGPWISCTQAVDRQAAHNLCTTYPQPSSEDE